MSDGALPPVRPTPPGCLGPRRALRLADCAASEGTWARAAPGVTLACCRPMIRWWHPSFGLCRCRLPRGFRVATAPPPPPRRRLHLVVAPPAAALPVPCPTARMPSWAPTPTVAWHLTVPPALMASVRRLAAALAYPLPSRRSSPPPPSPRRLPLCRRCLMGSPRPPMRREDRLYLRRIASGRVRVWRTGRFAWCLRAGRH